MDFSTPLKGTRLRARACATLVGLWLAGPVLAATPLEEAERLLQAGQAAEAAALYEKVLQDEPDSIEAHLGLGRAYYAMDDYARARIEFEAVFDVEEVDPDLLSQVEIYDQMAADYQAGKRFRPFYYAETGVGTYRENTSGGTSVWGGSGDYDTFLPIRVGMGWNADATERHSFNGLLDYRFRYYDETARRNDSDLRWNFNLSRPIDDDNLRFGMRGRVSYRGDGQYRNDWGVFTDYRLAFGERDQLTVGGEVRERRYPSGPLRVRTRDIAELTANWSHSLEGGRSSFSFGGMLGQEWATQDRPDGDMSYWGLNTSFDHAFNDNLDAFLWMEYIDEGFDDERPEPTDPDLLTVRQDELFYLGAGLIWGFAEGWSLRPTIEYDWEDSNIDALAYSKIDAWVTVRKSF